MATCKVELVSITQPLITGVNSAEELIVYTAKVSNPNNQINVKTAPKLIKYLLDNNHYSPFEQVDLGISIETSRGISPQILRHWSFSFQEFSQRYAEVQEYITYPARRQDTEDRQNSIDDLDQDTKNWFETAQATVWDTCFSLYKEAITKGIAKEQARFLLPLNTKTKIYMKGNLRDWIFYLKLRSGNGTQKEHQEIAQSVISQIFKPKFPIISEALEW
jgi:thymidylate synthase (FAD)